MNDALPGPVSVAAPDGAIAWSVSLGFIDDLDELTEARIDGDLLLPVTDDDPAGLVASVEGDAPLACVVRIDRELLTLTRVLARLAERVSDLGDRAAGLDTGIAVEVAQLKTRVRKLETR